MKKDNNPHGLKVGQEIVITGSRSFSVKRGPVNAVVRFIGRKYFTVNEIYPGEDSLIPLPRKFDLKTLRDVTDTNYPIRVFLSRSEYLQTEERSSLDSRFTTFSRDYYSLRSKLKLEDLRDIVKAIDKAVENAK